MGDQLDHIESAIAEVAKTRAAVSKGNRQVRSDDERARLKATAFAWFRSHRPHVADFDLVDIDGAYQTVLDATAMNAARSTYVDALDRAKGALIELRRKVAISRPAIVADAAPSFASLAGDPKMQDILNRRWEEVNQCISAGANLAATVMMGGLLESLLIARINVASNKSAIFTAKAAPRDKAAKTLPLSDWKLVALVEVAHELGWLTKSAKDVGNVLREFRNYVHPHKEHSDGIVITNADAGMFWEVSKAITRQILASVGKP